ncbi:tail fiber domain-containing protein [Kordia jejudonensis]|uniref:tail fiber domain-containing protein n=1 Tax=Kordia jejudonensis TaxID=1348245 RepID=UPI00138E36CF|nr:tail fiber domain-containing protein [Kordia jejudonensis]
MKKFILPITLFFAAFTFAQNQSNGAVASTINTPLPLVGETFRFDQGLVTQLDTGINFDFNNSTWFSLGKLNTGSQNVYGLRFQLPNRAITMGYQDISDANPRIQWIGDSTFSGTDLEFRVADSFTSTGSRIVATMTNDGKTYFGIPFTPTDETLVGVDYSSIATTNRTGITAQNTNGASGTVVGLKSINNVSCQEKKGVVVTTNGGAFNDIGVDIELNRGFNTKGVNAIVNSIGGDTYGVYSSISSTSFTGGFGASIYGSASITNPNWYAGYFDGDVVVAGLFTSSDRKLKEEINNEKDILERIMELNAVNYKFKSNKNLNLPEGLQHGFIAQDLEEIFPELVTTIQKPIIDAENKVTETYEYKAVNYTGLISILTSSIQELNEKVIALENEKSATITSEDSQKASKEVVFSMEQNIPNPFSNSATISYTLPKNARATITVFDMTGKYIREYDVKGQTGELVINSNEIGKGMFLYSLISRGKIIVTKKMMVK